MLLDIGLKADALHVLHHEVGGAVFLEVTPNPHDIGIFLELCQNPGLLQEALHSVLKVLLPLAAVNRNPQHAGGPDRHAVRHKFFDRDFSLQLIVQG